MHETMIRLYAAADTLKGLRGQSEVARALNVSPQTINNWEARGMSKSGMLNAQSTFGCSATWLATGGGSMEMQPSIPVQGMMAVGVSDHTNPATVQIRKVELRLSAGITGFQTEPDRRDGGLWDLPRRWVEKNNLIPAQLLALDVKGESMEPSLYEGDVVVINTADTAPVNGLVYAFNYEGEAVIVIKRLVREGGSWWLYSDNQSPRFPKRLCRGQECIVIGRVIRRETDQI